MYTLMIYLNARCCLLSLIEFNTDIVSGHSIGNICLKSNISEYIGEMNDKYSLCTYEYKLPDGDKRISYILNQCITIVTFVDGNIFSIGCNLAYTGRYKNILYTGQSVGEIIKYTQLQRIFNGSLIIDNDFGFSFILPPPYDEIGDSINCLPSHLRLNEIYVSDFSSWKI